MLTKTDKIIVAAAIHTLKGINQTTKDFAIRYLMKANITAYSQIQRHEIYADARKNNQSFAGAILANLFDWSMTLPDVRFWCDLHSQLQDRYKEVTRSSVRSGESQQTLSTAQVRNTLENPSRGAA